MGLETAAIVALGVTAATTAVSVYGQVEQVKAEQDAAYAAEVELNKIAAAEASDAANAADAKAARAMAAMEAIGGFGSYNDTRLQMEMAGLKGLDLARIESNRAREAAKLQAARKSLANQATGSFFKGLGKVAGSVAGAYGSQAAGLAIAEQGQSQVDLSAGYDQYD